MSTPPPLLSRQTSIFKPSTPPPLPLRREMSTPRPRPPPLSSPSKPVYPSLAPPLPFASNEKSLSRVQHARASYPPYLLLSLRTHMTSNRLSFSSPARPPPFPVGCSSPCTRLAEPSWRFALDASNFNLPGENPTCSVTAL